MKKTPLPALLGAFLAATLPARAGEITVPADSTPAFILQVPDDWTSGTAANGTLDLRNAKSTANISFTVASNAGEIVKTPIDQFARKCFDEAGIKTIDNKEPVTVAGIKGMAYYGALPYDGKSDNGLPVHLDAAVNIKIIILYIDATHYLAIFRGTSPNLSAADLAILDKIVSTAKPAPVK